LWHARFTHLQICEAALFVRRFVKPLCSAVKCALPPPWRKDKALPESDRIVELK